MDPKELDELLELFYVDVRKKDSELYKSSAFSLHIKVIMVYEVIEVSRRNYDIHTFCYYPIHFVIVLSYDYAPCCKMFGITKQLLPGLLVDSADYHPSKELFPSGVVLRN